MLECRCAGTFDVAAGRTAGVEAGGENGCVVTEERVAGTKEVGEIGECVVGDRAGGAVDNEQTRSVALLRRSLGNEVRGE